EGDRAAGLAKLAPLDRKLGPQRRAQIEEYLNTLADLVDDACRHGPKSFLGLAQAVRKLTDPGLEGLTVGVPTAALLVQTLEQLGQMEKLLGEIKLPPRQEKDRRATQEAIQFLAAVSRESPEALFLGARATLHVWLSVPLLEADRIPEARREWQTALDVFQQTTTAPTLLPRHP